MLGVSGIVASAMLACSKQEQQQQQLVRPPASAKLLIAAAMPPSKSRRASASPDRAARVQTLPDFTPDSPVPHFTLNLDNDAQQRWAEIAGAFKNRVAKLVRVNAEALEEMQSLQKYVPATMLLRALPSEQRDELRALAALLDQPLSLLAMLQFCYEAFSLALLDGACGCTTLVQDHADGVLHARSLDWAFLEGLEELLVDLSVTSGGQLLYRSTSVVGYVGVLTAMRAGADGGAAGGFSVSLNYRRPFKAKWDEEGEPVFDLPPLSRTRPLLAAVRHAVSGGWLVATLLRHLVETASDYEEARKLLLDARLVAPCYVVLAGASAGQAAIFTCGAGRERSEEALGGGIDALCVANVDCHGEEASAPPLSSSSSRREPGPAEAKDFLHGESWLRRDLALKLARELASPAAADSVDAMQHCLGTPPIANDATIHHTVMCPATGFFDTQRSAGPLLLAACEYEPGAAVCRMCCACDKKSACFALKKAASDPEFMPGSLLRRRGGGYYCKECLPLTEDDLRGTTTTDEVVVLE